MRQAGDGQAVLSLRFGTVSHDLALVVLPFAAAVVVRVLALQEAAVRGEPVDGSPLPRPVRVPHEAATADLDAGLEGEPLGYGRLGVVAPRHRVGLLTLGPLVAGLVEVDLHAGHPRVQAQDGEGVTAAEPVPAEPQPLLTRSAVPGHQHARRRDLPRLGRAHSFDPPSTVALSAPASSCDAMSSPSSPATAEAVSVPKQNSM